MISDISLSEAKTEIVYALFQWSKVIFLKIVMRLKTCWVKKQLPVHLPRSQANTGDRLVLGPTILFCCAEDVETFLIFIILCRRNKRTQSWATDTSVVVFLSSFFFLHICSYVAFCGVSSVCMEMIILKCYKSQMTKYSFLFSPGFLFIFFLDFGLCKRMTVKPHISLKKINS